MEVDHTFGLRIMVGHDQTGNGISFHDGHCLGGE
jgi:hypothetical protein